MSEPSLKKARVERPSDTIVSRIVWTNVISTNTKLQAPFYESLLGWKAEINGFSDNWLEIKGPNKGTNFALEAVKAMEGVEPLKEGTVVLAVIVKDLEKYHEYVKDIEGLKIIAPPTKYPWGGYLATYESPTGVVFKVFKDFEKGEENGNEAEKKGETAEAKPADAHTNGHANGHANGHTETKVEAEKAMAAAKPSGPGSGICHVEIPCESLARVSKFFTDTFGWTFTSYGDEKYTFFEPNDPENPVRGGATVSTERIKHPLLYFGSPDINATLEKVKANGGAVVKEKQPLGPAWPGKFFAHFSDTEGNVWALYCDETKQNKK